MNTYWGVEVYLHAFLASAVDGSESLYPRGKSRRYPLDNKKGGPQSWSGRSGEEKDFLP
jgi:hypothetical protein